MQTEYNFLVAMYRLADVDNISGGRRNIKTLHSSIGAPPSQYCHPPETP
jgi:hypothetical protein